MGGGADTWYRSRLMQLRLTRSVVSLARLQSGLGGGMVLEVADEHHFPDDRSYKQRRSFLRSASVLILGCNCNMIKVTFKQL